MSKKRDDDIKDLVSSVNKIKKWKNRLIFSVIGIAVVGVIIVFLVILIGSETDEIVTAYNNLSGKPYDSKQQFGARNVKITKDNNGKLQIELILGNNKNDSDLNGTSDSDPGTPDGDSNAGDSGTNFDIDDGTWDGEGFAFNAMDAYDKMSFTLSNVAMTTLSNGVSLYTGIPWGDDGNWYNMKVGVINDYVSKNLGKGLVNGTTCHKDDYNSSSAKTINNITCLQVSWYPIHAFRDTKENGQIDGTWYSSDVDGRYGVAILEKNGTKYYLPITAGADSKGHTYPGGMVQTYIGSGSSLDNGYVTINSGGLSDQKYVTWGGSPAHGQSISIDDFRSGWSTNTGYKGSSVTSGHPSLSLEVNSALADEINKAGYNLVGYVIHK